MRRAPLSSGPPADGNRALVCFLGVASPPRLAARGPRHFRPQLWAVRGAPRRVRTGRGLDLASFRLPLGGAAQGAGGLSSRGISMVGVLPALAARAGPLAPASQWPASTPPARSLRGARRKWPRDHRGLGPEVSSVWSPGREAGRRGGAFGGGRAAGAAAAPESGRPRAAASAPGRAPDGKRRWRPGDGGGRREQGRAGPAAPRAGASGAAGTEGLCGRRLLGPSALGAGVGRAPGSCWLGGWSLSERTERTEQDAALCSEAAVTGGRIVRGRENGFSSKLRSGWFIRRDDCFK